MEAEIVSKPSVPSAARTAAAQADANRDTAIAQQSMNMVDQIGPWGSVTYDQTGVNRYQDAYGRWIETPTYSQTTTLSPSQQAALDQAQSAQGNLAQIANQQTDWLKSYMQGGVDTSGAPSLVGNPGLNTSIGGGYNSTFGTGIGGYNPAFSGNIGNGYNSTFGTGIDGYNAGFSGDIGGGYGTSLGDGYATSFAGAEGMQPYIDDYYSSVWDRGAGERGNTEAALRTTLANKGIREGSAAWDAEMERLARQNTDASLATRTNALQNASTIAGVEQNAQNLGNNALLNQGNFTNNAALGQAQFGQNAQGLSNNAALAQAQFGSQQQQNQNAAALGAANYGTQAQGLSNNAALAQAQFGSQQQQNQNAAALGAANYGTQAQGLSNQAALAGAQFGSSQQQNQNAAALAQGQFGNNAAAQNMQMQNAARQQAIQEAYQARNQPLNEISALLGGSQVTAPSYTATPQTGVGGVDYSGIQSNINQQAQSQYGAGMGGLFGLGGTLLGASSNSILGGLFGLSDRRAKTDIRKVGKTDGGLNIYAFRYKHGGPMQMGVMANEVAEVNPGAVARHPNGYLMVDYSQVQ